MCGILKFYVTGSFGCPKSSSKLTYVHHCTQQVLHPRFFFSSFVSHFVLLMLLYFLLLHDKPAPQSIVENNKHLFSSQFLSPKLKEVQLVSRIEDFYKVVVNMLPLRIIRSDKTQGYHWIQFQVAHFLYWKKSMSDTWESISPSLHAA